MPGDRRNITGGVGTIFQPFARDVDGAPGGITQVQVHAAVAVRRHTAIDLVAGTVELRFGLKGLAGRRHGIRIAAPPLGEVILADEPPPKSGRAHGPDFIVLADGKRA